MEKKRSPQEIIIKMIDYLIEMRVKEHPYITMVSKKQLWFGNGLWKDCKDSEVKNGLRKYLGIRIPSKVEIENKNEFYGYPALQEPWSFLNNITNNAIRQGILWEVIDGKKYSDIRPILGMGYVQKDGTLDPSQTKGISCYVFFHADRQFREIQNDWVRMQADWVQLQIIRNKTTHHKLLAEKQKQATRLIKNNKKLLALTEYKEIEVPIDREKITWKDE